MQFWPAILALSFRINLDPHERLDLNVSPTSFWHSVVAIHRQKCTRLNCSIKALDCLLRLHDGPMADPRFAMATSHRACWLACWQAGHCSPDEHLDRIALASSKLVRVPGTSTHCWGILFVGSIYISRYPTVVLYLILYFAREEALVE